jgi:hypothetical protein
MIYFSYTGTSLICDIGTVFCKKQHMDQIRCRLWLNVISTVKICIMEKSTLRDICMGKKIRDFLLRKLTPRYTTKRGVELLIYNDQLQIFYYHAVGKNTYA